MGKKEDCIEFGRVCLELRKYIRFEQDEGLIPKVLYELQRLSRRHAVNSLIHINGGIYVYDRRSSNNIAVEIRQENDRKAVERRDKIEAKAAKLINQHFTKLTKHVIFHYAGGDRVIGIKFPSGLQNNLGGDWAL